MSNTKYLGGYINSELCTKVEKIRDTFGLSRGVAMEVLLTKVIDNVSETDLEDMLTIDRKRKIEAFREKQDNATVTKTQPAPKTDATTTKTDTPKDKGSK